MLNRCLGAQIISAGMVVMAAGYVYGQDYPNKPIRILTSSPGGGNDFVARIVGKGISASLGQPVVVDNRIPPTASVEAVSKAAPDGYTLLVASSTFVTGHLLQRVLYDPVKDFAPITYVGNTPNILLVHPSVPARSVKELIALARAKPGQLNYGSSGPGASAHLSAELLKSMSQIDITQIGYRGNTPSLVALIRGEIQLLFPTVPPASPHLKSGKLRALAVTGMEPSILAPGVPTMSASGLTGYRIESIYGVLAPAKTPGPIINRLDQEMVRFLNTSEAKASLLTIGIEAVNSTPREYAALIKDEAARMSKLIKDAGIRAE